MNLVELKNEILKDGVIDEDEVKQIAIAIYEDGKIDEEEANFLFELNDACSGKANHASWGELFIKAIVDYLLTDEVSPGTIDDDEAKWLADQIGGDGQVDPTEKALLEKLKADSKNFPDILNALL